jgi:hypothetical protein
MLLLRSNNAERNVIQCVNSFIEPSPTVLSLSGYYCNGERKLGDSLGQVVANRCGSESGEVTLTPSIAPT